MEQIITYRSYQEYKQELDTELKKTAEGFVRIGYLLKVARDTNILAESGYKNVVDFARAEYGIDKTQVSRFIHINDKFSQGGYAPELKEEYQGFGYAKLSIMLSLPESINEELPPDFSKAEVQEIKDEVDRENKTTEIEILLEEKDQVQQSYKTNLEKAVYQLGKDEPKLYEKLWISAVKNGDSGKQFMENLIPDEKAVYIVRIPGTGRVMLSMKMDSDEVKLINVRDETANERYTKQELESACKRLLIPGKSWKEAWEALYQEKAAEEKTEVAPVQPGRNAPRKESRVIVPKSRPEKEPEQTENIPKSEESGKWDKMPEPEEIKLHDVNPDIPEPDPETCMEQENAGQGQPDAAGAENNADTSKIQENEQIPGQDDILNHPELLPEQEPVRRGTEKMVADIKMEASVIKTSVSGWEYYIPRQNIDGLLNRLDHLRELLVEMRDWHEPGKKSGSMQQTVRENEEKED